jgi:antitoxin component of RelBE/YafQ-DinJ toxin-antitoxin module
MAFKRFHIHLEEELKDEFDEYAKELGLSLSALFRLALIEKMKKDGK